MIDRWSESNWRYVEKLVGKKGKDMPRSRLPNRRLANLFAFKVATHDFIGSFGAFEDGRPAELFINTDMQAGSQADCNASDAAVAVSLALQYGCPLDELRQAMKRDDRGAPQGPIGAALDEIAKITGG